MFLVKPVLDFQKLSYCTMSRHNASRLCRVDLFLTFCFVHTVCCTYLFSVLVIFLITCVTIFRDCLLLFIEIACYCFRVLYAELKKLTKSVIETYMDQLGTEEYQKNSLVQKVICISLSLLTIHIFDLSKSIEKRLFHALNI